MLVGLNLSDTCFERTEALSYNQGHVTVAEVKHFRNCYSAILLKVLPLEDLLQTC